MSNESFNGKVIQALERKADIDLLNVSDEKLSTKIETSVSALETSPGSTVRFIHVVDSSFSPNMFGVGTLLFNTDTEQLFIKQNASVLKSTINEVSKIVSQGVDANGIWYIQYGDGVLEQGGVTTGTGTFGSITIALPKSFKDTNYTVCVNTVVGDSSIFTDLNNIGTLAYASDMYGVVADKTINSFKISSKTSHSWFARGLI